MTNNNSSNNQFARFASTSPLSSIPHEPSVTLASNCIRDFFGPTVQLVADALMSRSGGSTLPQIISIIETKAYITAGRSNERQEIMRLAKMRSSTINSMNSNGDPPPPASVRAALLALIQHSVVKVQKRIRTVTSTKKKKKKSVTKTTKTYLYEIDIDRARIFPRYPQFVEYIKKQQDETAATLIEEILVQGRVRTVQAIALTVEQIQKQEDDSSSSRSDHRYTSRQAVLESFLRLARNGYIEEVNKIKEVKEDDDHVETEFGGPLATENADDDGFDDDEDPTIVSLLRTGPYKNLPAKSIWRINTDMFHEQMRAVRLGWLIAERYNHKLQSSGSIVSAALKLAAHNRYGNNNLKSSNNNPNSTNGNAVVAAIDFESIHNFAVEKIPRFLPKTIVQSLEKKEGGVIDNIYKALVDLTQESNPVVVEQVEVAPGQPGQCTFQIQTRKLVEYLRDRIVHQIVRDTHGETAARIVSILRSNGYMESEQVAATSMNPSKDTLELLYRLYRDEYIDLFNVSQTKQHNVSSMIYLWGYSRHRCTRTAADNVCTALCNMRLRRQHQVEVGSNWIEREKEADATDENDNETDKIMKARFWQGLERLDNAAIQLDETLIILKDY
mmetsp:Transcript_25857/g.56690  ORF Transcript_25857/g.56690 Transcript_25857/m.56690 type:complete len:615 (+) Transcript_25857:119-1963(+)|eukprot:CAMPEP_0168185794 /NCGR_PEP_ID=MMETSP0139_2-20121125/14049_1 /TAXON_ID=44445 /ORGANISM="Pseudo-nitzschia australis, Strain 10249 10 AB" /LENGTH=614 /DNA_ID=CAMNT_0008107679 /DNA_START=103 /DNA_END=1950 /DNA_ORIENTATION=-